ANFGISQGWIGPATFPIQMADVNGDGLMDIIGFRDHVQVSLSTGNGFTPPANWISDFTSQQGWTHNTPVQLRDVNGDGMADLVGYGTNGVVIALSNGRSFSKSNWNGGNVYPNFGVSQGWSATRNLRLVADVDGNGLSDLIGFGNTNVEVGLNPGPFPDLLTNISNGLGGEFAINYTTLADRNVYSFDGALNSNTASAQSQLNAPLPLNSTYLVNGQVNLQGGQSIVVKNYTEQNNASVNAQTYHYPFQFTYKNAAYDNQGRGWMGFAEISQQNLDLGTQQEVFYLQKFPFTGKEYQITNYCGDGSNDPNCGSGKILGRQRISYYCQPDSACNSADQALTQPFPNVYQVLQKNHFTDKYQYNQYYFSLLNVKSYDKYGNTIIDAEYGRTNQAGKDQDSSDNLFTLSYFSNDASQNIFGYVLAQKKSSSSDSTGLAGCNCGTSPTYSAADLSLQAIAYSSEMTVNTVCNWDNLRSTWDASTYAYDQYGNDTLETNPAGNATSKVIESTYQTYLDHTVSPPNSNGDRLVTHYGFDPRSGLQVGQIGPNGNANLVIIDDFGFQVAVQGPVPQGQNINKGQNRLGSFVTGSGGFAAADVVDLSMQTIIQTGSSIYVEAKELQNWANGAGYKVMYNYLDGRNRKYKEEVLQPCNANGTITSGAVFNSADKFLNKTLPHFSNAHAVAQMSTIYDAYQRPVRRSSTAGPSGQDSTVTTFAYSMDSKGLTTTETAASADAYAYSKVSFFEFFNKKQRATSITIVTDNNAQTSYTYDPMGRARTVTTPPAQNNSAGLTDSTYYDSQGRKYRTYNASLGAETYLYGSNGKVQTLTNGQGSSSFTYDNLARLIRRDFPDGRKVLLTYDSSGISNSLGQLTHISSFNTDNSTNYTSAYVYDRYGNRALEEMDIFNVKGGTQSFITTKVFDPQNRLTAITFPDQTTMYYRYNTCALDTILVGDTTLATFSNFSPFEKPGQISYGNGAQARFLYSPENKMSSHKVWAKGGSAILYDSLTWDHLNQITGIQDLRGSGTDHSQQFTYTSRRLSQASAVNTYQDIAYLYDQAGNLVQKGDVSFTYAGFQVTDGDSNGTNVFHAEYGEMGTMSLRKRGNTSQNLAYDSENRLTSVSTDGQTETYRYDYQGRRIYKADAEGNVTLYVNSEFEKVIFADNKTQTTRYAVTPWGILAALTSNGGEVGKSGIPGAGIRYIHGNNIQSTVVTTNAAGALGTRIIYQPYGGVWKMDGENDFRPKFTGKELDIGTTLYYFGGRYYDAFTGRFITADTELGANTTRQDAFNRYAYVLNNPLIFIDFNGHSPWWEDALMITADVALVTGGVALIVLTDGAAAPIIGAALLSAGVSGAIYNVSNLGHQQLAGWGIQLGVGFVTGLVTGGIGAGGAALTGAAVDAAEDAGWSAARQTALTWGGRALTGAVAGAASSVAGQMTGNLLGGHQPFYHFSGWAVLENAGAGMVGNLIAAGAVAKFGDLGIGEGAPDAESLLGRLFYEAPARVIPKWTKIIVPFTFQINKTTIKATDPQW
ncbi:MAG TPA: hypothetical protein ENJ82_14510, partial [Bacteroidetes bacterium]|nr:hypothetical protein [Bacteroidota bacterium]